MKRKTLFSGALFLSSLLAFAHATPIVSLDMPGASTLDLGTINYESVYNPIVLDMSAYVNTPGPTDNVQLNFLSEHFGPLWNGGPNMAYLSLENNTTGQTYGIPFYVAYQNCGSSPAFHFSWDNENPSSNNTNPSIVTLDNSICTGTTCPATEEACTAATGKLLVIPRPARAPIAITGSYSGTIYITAQLAA